MKNARYIHILMCLLIIGGTRAAWAQSLDISSGGTPTISGTNGSVTGSSSVQNDLQVIINFGEVSPSNANSTVRVVVPIAVRSNQPYQVNVSASGTANVNSQALQMSDIGFGVANWRAMGTNSRVCTLSQHIFYSPFGNDPETNRSVTSAGRVGYAWTLASLSTSSTILSGPRLSNGGASRGNNDGYIFDAIFVITPQFFAASSLNATITFTISAGPNVSC
jgi:hypothetical protein